MEFVCVLGFIAIIIGLVVMSNRQTKAKRAPIIAQIDGMRAQMRAFREQGQHLDEKTAERMMEAQKAVNEKLDQAAVLLKTATQQRHYDRIGRILTQVQAKLGNSQASLGRAKARADERVQRQAQRQTEREAEQQARQDQRAQESAARRAGSFGQRAAQTVPQRGSFAPPAQVTSAATTWNTIPPRERGVCFFCSRPCLLRELTPVTVPIGGNARRVLACPQDYATIQSGSLPQIRAFMVGARPVPWYAYNRYNPYDDYYPGGYGVNFYLDMYPYGAFDGGYWNFDGPYQYDNGSDGGQPYNFTPDTEAAQDFFSGMAMGEGAGVMGAAFDPHNPNFDPQHGGMDFAGDLNHPGNYPDNGDPQADGPDVS